MFVCVENNEVIGILEYEPNVPETVSVYKISELDYKGISDNTHKFDAKKKKVVEIGAKDAKELEKAKVVFDSMQFLDSTDWKVMRHIREKALGMKTSLTDDDYLKLEKERHIAAAKIK